MSPVQIAKTYDKLASFWAGQEFDQANGLEAHRRALRFLHAKPDSHGQAINRLTALEVGCGSSGRLTELLLTKGFEITGVDISEEMLRLAKERQPEAAYHRADIAEWELPQAYHLISAWDSIWHVPLAQQEGVVRKLCQGLMSGGVLIFTAGGLDIPSECEDMMMGQPIYHATLGVPRLMEIIASEICVCRHLEYDQHPEMHVYLIVEKAANAASSSAVIQNDLAV